MNKLEMAHEWFMKHANGNTNFIEIEVEKAWQYADAMQAEADKREDKTRPAVLQEEWQPDWSQAPDEYKWAGVTSDCAGNITGTIFFVSEPEICETTVYSYYIDVSDPILNDNSFGYTGSWRDSLRKRPESGFKRYYGDGLECAR